MERRRKRIKLRNTLRHSATLVTIADMSMQFMMFSLAVSLRKGRSYKSGGTDEGGSFSGFLPKFYGVGSFNPILVKWWARSVDEQCCTLQSQLTAERARHLVKHLGEESALRKNLSIFSPHKNDAFKNRFTYGLGILSRGNTSFPGSNRAPVGLNPERFIERCRGCDSFLLGCEYGTEFCPKRTLEDREDSSSGKKGSRDDNSQVMATVAAQSKKIAELKTT